MTPIKQNSPEEEIARVCGKQIVEAYRAGFIYEVGRENLVTVEHYLSKLILAALLKSKAGQEEETQETLGDETPPTDKKVTGEGQKSPLTNYVTEARIIVMAGIDRTPNLPDYVKPLAKAIVTPIFSALGQAIGGLELTVYRTERAAPSVTPSISSTAPGAAEEKELYPDPMTPEQRKLYDEAMEEIRPELEKMCKELDDCTRLSAADFAVTINAR